jgi:hypothetical protein
VVSWFAGLLVHGLGRQLRPEAVSTSPVHQPTT